MTVAALIKKRFNWVPCLRFRGSVHYHHDGENGGVQADVVLELRELHLKATGSRLEQETPEPAPQ